jgi:hypothetical protein
MAYWKEASATLVVLGFLGTAAQAAAPLCTTPEEMSALRTAALQQQLMVAGLTCNASDSYNRFVLAYRPELQRSDAELKAYFIRRSGEHGEAEYDTFKTKLANLSSLSDIAQPRGYCSNARITFEMAMRGRQSLSSFVAGQNLLVALPEQTLCAAARPALMRTVQAHGSNEEVNVPLHSAPPQISTAPIAVAGVPRHALPATPYGVGSEVALAPVPAPLVAATAPASYAPPVYRPAPPAYAPAADYPDNAPSYDEWDAPPPPPPPPPRRPAYGAPAWPPGWGQFPWSRWYGYRYYYGR